ncbi:unnamed protein product, partial [Brassica rapa]
LGYRISKEHAHEGCRVQWRPERLSYNSLAFISRSFDQLYSQFVGVLYDNMKFRTRAQWQKNQV